jgi:hypothetical protein
MVTQKERAVSPDEIENADFFAVPTVVQIITLRPFEYHADPEQVEQLAQLGLDQLIEVVGRLRFVHVVPRARDARARRRPC